MFSLPTKIIENKGKFIFGLPKNWGFLYKEVVFYFVWNFLFLYYFLFFLIQYLDIMLCLPSLFFLLANFLESSNKN